MQKLSIKQAEKEIIGAGKKATLVVDSQTLLKVFGEPEYAIGWDKVKYMWAFQNPKTKHVITIYDYKEKRDLDKIDEWSVGSRGLLVADVIQFINDKFDEAGQTYKELA